MRELASRQQPQQPAEHTIVLAVPANLLTSRGSSSLMKLQQCREPAATGLRTARSARCRLLVLVPSPAILCLLRAACCHSVV